MNTFQPIEGIKTLWLTLTNKCNHRCRFCFQEDFTKDLPEIALHRLEQIFPTIEYLLLLGGEVTVFPKAKELIENIIKINSNIKLDIVTNGHKFDTEWQDIFLKFGRAVHFSVNAATQDTYNKITEGGNWDELIANIWNTLIRRGSRKYPIVRTSIVVTDDNLHELYDFCKMCDFIGVDLINTSFDPFKFPKDKQLVIEQATKCKDIKTVDQIWPNALINFARGTVAKAEGKRQAWGGQPCPLPSSNLMVDYDGSVRFCCMMDKKIGNLCDIDLSEIWNSAEAQEIRRLFNEAKYEEAKCNLCRCGAFNEKQ